MDTPTTHLLPPSLRKHLWEKRVERLQDLLNRSRAQIVSCCHWQDPNVTIPPVGISCHSGQCCDSWAVYNSMWLSIISLPEQLGCHLPIQWNLSSGKSTPRLQLYPNYRLSSTTGARGLALLFLETSNSNRLYCLENLKDSADQKLRRRL